MTTSTSPVTGVDFVAVPSADWKRSRAFYVDTLGLRPDETRDSEFWVGQTCFGIYEPATYGMQFAPQTTAHLALHVDDVEAARASLRVRGVELESEPHLIHTDDAGMFGPPGGEEWMAFLRDSEGNLVGLSSRRNP